jgi:hypothetical protein
MDTGKSAPDIDLFAVAHAYLERWFPDRPTGSMADTELVHWDEEFCRRVARWYDRAPALDYDARLSRRYDRFKQETEQQYHAIVDAGIRVVPWLGPGQPYRTSAELCESVRSTGTIYVYLTRSGHGAAPSHGFHPLREPSAITVDGVQFAHNDLFRSVHDIFGHVMYGNSFSAKGEFRATFCHMRMFSEDVHPVLFTEQVAQICWYYFGPYLRQGGPRQYPEQKVFEFPPSFLQRFTDMFHE